MPWPRGPREKCGPFCGRAKRAVCTPMPLSRPSLGLTPCSTQRYPQCTGPPLSHTGTHTHPRARREPGPSPRALRRRPLQPHAYLEVAPATVPPWRPQGAGTGSGVAAESDSGQGSAGAEQRLRAGSGRRLHPRSAPGRRRRRQRRGPGGSGARSLRAARSEGAPAPALPLAAARHRRRRPATAPHTSIIHRPSSASRAKPITGGGSANGAAAAAAAAEEAASRAPGLKRQPSGDGDGPGARGGGSTRGTPGKLPTARDLRRAPGPSPRDHPPGVRPRGVGGSGEAGSTTAGGGEGGGARKEDERLADLPRRLQGAPARARPPRPASLTVRPPSPSPPPALTRARRQSTQPLCCKGARAGRNRRQLTFQTCTQGWCWCTPPPSERTTRRAALKPPGGGGDQALPRPPPSQAINLKQHLCERSSRSAVAQGGRREGAGVG